MTYSWSFKPEYLGKELIGNEIVTETYVLLDASFKATVILQRGEADFWDISIWIGEGKQRELYDKKTFSGLKSYLAAFKHLSEFDCKIDDNKTLVDRVKDGD